jgi:hypothetical protein
MSACCLSWPRIPIRRSKHSARNLFHEYFRILLGSKGSFRPEVACQATWTIHIAGGIQFDSLPTSQPDPVQGAILTVQLPNPMNVQGSDAQIAMYADTTLHNLYIYKVAGPTPPE